MLLELLIILPKPQGWWAINIYNGTVNSNANVLFYFRSGNNGGVIHFLINYDNIVRDPPISIIYI